MTEHDRRRVMTTHKLRSWILLTSMLLLAASVESGEEHQRLDRLKSHNNRIIINFPDSYLSQVLKTIAQAGEFKLTLDESFRDIRVNVPKQDTTIKRILVRLAQTGQLKYSVPNDEELVVESEPE
jgi:hypothetical protein